jgi:ABC-type uncharacterized transport system involved in gliding motility auxiliary subunit
LGVTPAGGDDPMKASTVGNIWNGLEIVMVLAVLVAANIVAGQHFLRADLTEDKEYTISPATKKILSELDDVVSIRAYFSEKLPPRLQQVRRQVADFLDEYRNYGRGHIQVEWVDPSKDPELEQQVRFLGIPQIQAQILEKDQLQVTNVYMGIGVQYGDRRQAIPVVQDTYTLEYDLTSAILRVSLDEDKVVGFLVSDTEDLDKKFHGIRQLLQDQYEVRTVDLDGGRRSVPDDIETLIIASPQNVSEREKYEIDQFIMRGGRAIFLVDVIRLDERGGLRARPVTSGLEDLLAHYGVRVQKGIVKDNRFNSTASFSTGFFQYTVPYPFWPKVTGPFLSRDHIMTSRLESLVLPWPAPLKLDVPTKGEDPLLKALREDMKEKAPELDGSEVLKASVLPVGGSSDTTEAEEDTTSAEEAPVVAHILARTSPYSEFRAGRYDLTPDTNPLRALHAQVGKSYVVAATLEGKFRSFFADKPVPAPEGEEAEADTTAEATKITESPPTRLVVLGNSFFIQDNFLPQFPENSVFFQNAVDWLTLGPELIGIRSRGATDRPLVQLSDATKTAIKLAVTLGPALLVVVIGLVRNLRRRRRRAHIEAELRKAAAAS